MRLTEAFLHAVDRGAEHFIEFDHVLRDLRQGQTQQSIRAQRRHAHAEQIRRLAGVVLRRHREPFALHARDPGSLEQPVSRGTIRHRERALEIEHELDVVLRQDPFLQILGAPARNPEAFDDTRQVRRRQCNDEFPRATGGLVCEAVKRPEAPTMPCCCSPMGDNINLRGQPAQICGRAPTVGEERMASADASGYPPCMLLSPTARSLLLACALLPFTIPVAAGAADPFKKERSVFQRAYEQVDAAEPQRPDSEALRTYPLYPYLQAARIRRALADAGDELSSVDQRAQTFITYYEKRAGRQRSCVACG